MTLLILLIGAAVLLVLAGSLSVDITTTAANVVTVADADNVIERNQTAGATITAGQSLYLDTSDGKWKLFDANSGTAAVRTLQGIALNGASNGQPLDVQTAGTINLGATLSVGLIYVGSVTPGGIAPSADLATGWYTNVLGVALTAANLKMRMYASGTVLP